MKRINILDEHTSNKIAAGEVVERPSSVVKELIENSIDAEAKNITIEIEEGGCSLIRIIDDGNGIHKDDIKKAFMPHATSKIKDVEDIYSILTLGFRGEALASIAAISKVNLKSKTEADEFGSEIIIEGGVIQSTKDIGCNKGTIMEVRDLFYNVPARKKFLKSISREGSLIGDIINRIALSNPDISIKFYNNGKKVLHTYGTGNLKDVIRTVYGKTISENIIYFESKEEDISLYGYIGKEEISRGSRNNQSIFVNGRYIKNKTIVAAVENAFKSFATVNKFPFFVLFLEVYPEFVDVNIHPTKAEIKFKEDRIIFKKIFDLVHKAFKLEVFNDFYIPEEEKEEIEEKNKIDEVENISFNMEVVTREEEIYREPIINKDLDNLSYDDIKKEEELYKALKNSNVVYNNNNINKSAPSVVSEKREQINEDIKSMGLKNSKLNRKTKDERMPEVNIENITSAYDLCMMWKHLYNGTFLNKDNGQMLIDILQRQQIKNKLALYIQDDLKSEISSKTGDKPSVENDTEYIHNKKGNFTFTVLSEKVPNSVYGTITLAKCGKMMWDEITNNWS